MAELFRLGHVTLTWPEGHPLHGLEVVCRRRPLGELNDLTLEVLPGDDKAAADWTPKERVARSEANAARLAEIIVSWNMEALGPDGEGLGYAEEHTQAGLLATIDGLALNDMWTAYHETVTRLAPPLSQSSGGGSPAAPEPPEDWEPGETSSP